MERYFATYRYRKTDGTMEVDGLKIGLLSLVQFSFKAETDKDALRMAEEKKSDISDKTGQGKEHIILERLVCARNVPFPTQQFPIPQTVRNKPPYNN